MRVCPQCKTENPSKAKFCMNCRAQLIEVGQLSEEDKLKLYIAELERENQLLKDALEQQVSNKNNKEISKGISTEIADVKEVGSHTIFYEATDRLSTCWIDNNSVSHEFVNGKGEIRLMDSVTIIGDEAFSGCSEMTSIVIPDCVTGFGWCAFAACSSLKKIIIPKGTRSKYEELLFGYKDIFVEQ